MSPSASSLLLIGNPSDRRTAELQAARAALGLDPARVLSYWELLAGRADLAAELGRADWVRIESPGKDQALELALIAAGAARLDPCDPGWIDPATLNAPLERGRFLGQRQWYAGFCAVLDSIDEALAACVRPPQLMNTPAAIGLMFDKPRCWATLKAAGVAVPRSFGTVYSWAELQAALAGQRQARVFLKPAHGSSAAGVVAFAQSPQRVQAVTTVEMAEADGERRLYASRRLRTYTRPSACAALVDALGRDGLHVEQWLPKASIGDYAYDLRIVVIGGRACHSVVRMSRSPMTNLHLRNPRGDVAQVRAQLGEAAWAALAATCEAAVAAVAGAGYAGVDALVTPGGRRRAVLELNAFGDLLPGVLYEGLDTYGYAMERLCLTPAP